MSFKQILALFQSFFEKHKTWATWEVQWDAQTPEKLDESSPCLLLHQTWWVVWWSSFSHLQAIESCYWKEGNYPRCDHSFQLHLRIFQKNSISSKSGSSNPLASISWAPALARTSSLFSNVLCCLGVIGIKPSDCPKSFVFGTTASSKLAEKVPGRLLSFVEQAILQSEKQNLDQRQETPGFFRWKLRKPCCLKVSWKCANGSKIENLAHSLSQWEFNTFRTYMGWFCPFSVQGRFW